MPKKGASSLVHLSAAFLASGLVLLFGLLPPIETLERRLLDLAFQIRGPERPHPDIAIIDINDQSLVRMGSWPWPRSIHADLLNVLIPFKPGVVFYDMIFSEPSEETEDRVLSEAIKRHGNVVLPFYFSAERAEGFVGKAAIFPQEAFRESARRIGYVNVIPDRDGHIRQMIPRVPDFEHASVAVALLQQGYGGKKLSPFVPFEPIWINFPGPYDVFPRIHFDHLIEHFERPDVQSFLKSVKGKIVLVGHTATGTALDLKPTAFSSQYPGVGLQASILHTLLTGKLIRRLPLLFHFLLLFCFAVLVIWTSRTSSPVKGLFYVVTSLILFFEMAQIAFKYALLWVPFFGYAVLGPGLYAGITLVQFVRERLEREIISRELVLASRIQKNLLPAEIPSIPGIDIVAVSLPARHVGGDFYDILPVPNGKWGICVGDVSGKGVPAALFMAKAISEFRREVDSGAPSAVIRRLNVKISNEGVGGLFLTLLYLIVDLADRKIVFSSGGHEPIFFYQKRTHSVRSLSTREGMPLGVDSNGAFDDQEERVETGDILLLQSDGVKEAMNSRRQMFGVERIRSVLLESASLDSRFLVDRLLEKIKDFVKDAPQHDDLTMVSIKFAF